MRSYYTVFQWGQEETGTEIGAGAELSFAKAVRPAAGLPTFSPQPTLSHSQADELNHIIIGAPHGDQSIVFVTDR